jgi:hypothetical protein
MGTSPALKSRTFDLAPECFFARQDRIFDAAVEAVLSLGGGVLDQFPQLGAVETKATGQLNGCLLLWGINREENPHFVVIQAERVSRWLIRTRYKVTVHWAIPHDSIAPVLRLCDPAIEIAADGPVRTEPLVKWLSQRLPGKDVLGCNPGYFARLQVIDGQFHTSFVRQG